MSLVLAKSVLIPCATLERKQRLVKLLLSQSPAIQRISQSNNAQAKKNC
ncbi:MAG: hypothetical protein ABIQ90_09575 [Polaromonas sp.]